MSPWRRSSAGRQPGSRMPLAGPAPTHRWVRVDEQFLLIDRASQGPVTASQDLIGVSGTLGQPVAGTPDVQVSLRTEPSTRMAEVGNDVARRRQRVRVATAELGLLACASGSFPHAVDAATSWASSAHLTCAMHVHVSVESAEEGVAVLDRTRMWLPILTALSANSPMWGGADSGYSSYRSVVRTALPSAGPMPLWGDVAGYYQCEEQVVATGLTDFDYDSRLAIDGPALEFRVTDVCQSVEETVALAALVRALVDTAAQSWRDGDDAPQTPIPVLRSCAWRASRFGMETTLFHPTLQRLEPAWDVAGALLAHVDSALALCGDNPLVRQLLVDLQRRGTGASRQRVPHPDGLSEVLRRTALAGTTPVAEDIDLRPIAVKTS